MEGMSVGFRLQSRPSSLDDSRTFSRLECLPPFLHNLIGEDLRRGVFVSQHLCSHGSFDETMEKGPMRE